MGPVYGRAVSEKRGTGRGLGTFMFIELFQLFVLKVMFVLLGFVFFKVLMAHFVFSVVFLMAVTSLTIYITYDG